MSRLVIGVIGHVDHGKTALVRALTGQDTDRLAEEKERGISIALGFAHFKAGPASHVDLIDMPGHEKFVRTMISGATGLDAVLLIVAANEGVKPQTTEHIDIAGLLGLRRAIVAITKTDIASADDIRRASNDAQILLNKSGFDPAPIIQTSALQGDGVEDLRQTLIALAAQQKPPAADGVAFLPIDRAFSMTGHGPVITGTLRGAAIKMGDELELLPSRQSVRARTAQVHGKGVATAEPGQRVALNLRGVEIADLKRGMALAAPGSLIPSGWLTIAIRAVESAQPLKNGMRVTALLGTEEIEARLRLLDRDVLQPGASSFAQLHCAAPIAIPAKEHVILRLASPPQTVAGGKVLEPVTSRQRRNAARTLKRLENLNTLSAVELITAEIEHAGRNGTTLADLSRLTALSLPRVAELLKPIPVVTAQSGLVVSRTVLDDLVARIPVLLAPHKAGLSQEALLAALPKTSADVLNEALARLISSNAINKRRGAFLVPRPDEDSLRARNEEELTSQILEALREGGLAPPSPAQIVTNPLARHAVDRLLRDGTIVRAVDRAKNKEILFHRDAIDDARRVLSPLLEKGDGLLATEIGAALGVSRKYTMPLLDHLDAIKFTRRIDDRRVLGSKPPP